MISSRVISAVDMFCGSGGTSAGLFDAAEDLGMHADITAINHWDVAIATHTASHKYANHICDSMANVNPKTLMPEGDNLDILVASPECTHFSKAAGGRPKSDQSRAGAWHVTQFAQELRPTAIIVENVEEFMRWGPLDDDMNPIKDKQGEMFHAWVASLKAMGYEVDWRVLNCADYGDVTTRRRLFVMARRDGRKVKWPVPSHTKSPDLICDQKWRAAREIIDWDNHGKSIFDRKKPLSRTTMRRIQAGIEKFCPEVSEFLVKINGTDEISAKHSPKSVDEPLRTITAGGKHFALVKTNFLINMVGTSDSAVKSTAKSPDEPLATIHGGNKHAMIELKPLVVEIDNHSNPGHCCREVDKPISTVVSKGRHCLVQPFLQSYYGTGTNVNSVDEPVRTLTTKQRHALVEPSIEHGKLDIKFRMLTNDELAKAHGMDDFTFYGNSAEVTKQIGNSVPRNMAKALCHAQLS